MHTTLIFTRHGETADNAAKRLSTAPPGPELSALGREQAEQLVDLLAGRTFKAIYASPLVRARQTAEFVARSQDLTVGVDEDLRELSVGSLEGRTDDAVFAHLDEVWEAWTFRGELDLPAGPGGETAAAVLARSVGAAQRIAAANPGGTILIVAHSGVLQLLIPGLCANLPMDYGYLHWLRNCQVVEVVTHGREFQCVTWADFRVPISASQTSSEARPV